MASRCQGRRQDRLRQAHRSVRLPAPRPLPHRPRPPPHLSPSPRLPPPRRLLRSPVLSSIPLTPILGEVSTFRLSFHGNLNCVCVFFFWAAQGLQRHSRRVRERGEVLSLHRKRSFLRVFASGPSHSLYVHQVSLFVCLFAEKVFPFFSFSSN